MKKLQPYNTANSMLQRQLKKYFSTELFIHLLLNTIMITSFLVCVKTALNILLVKCYLNPCVLLTSALLHCYTLQHFPVETNWACTLMKVTKYGNDHKMLIHQIRKYFISFICHMGYSMAYLLKSFMSFGEVVLLLFSLVLLLQTSNRSNFPLHTCEVQHQCIFQKIRENYEVSS